MANMTRAQMVTELTNRGWSRFASTDLERYLDWALQDLYNMAKLPRSTLSVFTSTALTDDEIPFTTITAAGAELVHQIKAVYVKYSGEVIKLEAADPEYFMAAIWPNLQATNPIKAPYPTHYYIYDLTVILYPKMEAAVDVYVHHLLREDVFSGASDTTALPERFDKAEIAQAESYCYRRAHEPEGMAMAQGMVREFLLDELGMAGAEMDEKQDRVISYQR